MRTSAIREPGQARRNCFTWQWRRDPVNQAPPCLLHKYYWVENKIEHHTVQYDMCNTGKVCKTGL